MSHGQSWQRSGFTVSMPTELSSSPFGLAVSFHYPALGGTGSRNPTE
jgi:hypothetical protein